MKTVIASGYFDPLHVGHLKYLKNARALGDQLLVIVNNDFQAELKKGKTFMRAVERGEIVASLACVNQVRISFDTDATVLKTLEWMAGDKGWGEIVFAKGGDSTPDNTPEKALCDTLGIQILFNIGGSKIQSSSSLIHG